LWRREREGERKWKGKRGREGTVKGDGKGRTEGEGKRKHSRNKLMVIALGR